MIWTVLGTRVGDMINMVDEFSWRADYCNPKNLSGQSLVDFIDSRFIDVISNVAWSFGFQVHKGDSKGKVRIPGETHVYINTETREVDFREVPKEMEEEVAVALQDAMDSFYEWEESLRGEGAVYVQ